jgi:translation initiation factor 1
MGKKERSGEDGYVFSTDPNFKIESGQQEQLTLQPKEQKLRVRLETKHRAGKAVTIIDGFIGSANDLEDLGKKLKNYCGTGGSVKDGEIIIQGDHREKLMQWFIKNNYRQAKRAGR